MKTLYLCLSLALFCPAQSWAWTPNDPQYQLQWGLQAIGMPEAWEYQRGGRRDVKIAVLDTGVAYDAPEFANTNFDFLNAWDFIDYDADPYDYEGHGTYVTSIIAQATNNKESTAGIAYDCTILPLRILNRRGKGEIETMANAIIYATDCGADIINISAVSVEGRQLPLEEACEYAANRGVIIIAATGNYYGQVCDRNCPLPCDFPGRPASYWTTLAVGAVNSSLEWAPFSQYAWSNCWFGDDLVDRGLVGPGVGVYQEIAPGYSEYMDGTSFATPHVTGVAALVLSEAYDLGIDVPETGWARVDWVRNILWDTAQDLGDPGYDNFYGDGLVRADNALRYLQTLAN